MLHLVTANESIPEDTHNSEINFSSLDQCIKYIEQLEFIAVDTETSGFSPINDSLFLLQLGDSIDQYIIDCTTVSILPLKELLENKNIILHNAKFDLKFLYHKGIYPYRNISDTFLQEKILNHGLLPKASLIDCVSKYCGVTLSKDQRANINKNTIYKMPILKYAALDIVYLHEINRCQNIIAEQQDLVSCIKFENAFVPVLAYTEYCGFKLDQGRWKAKMQSDEVALLDARKALDDYILDNNILEFITTEATLFGLEVAVNINWKSSHQVIKLCKLLNLDISTIDKYSKEVKDSVNAKVLSRLNHPLVDLFSVHQKYSKIVSTYGRNFLEQSKKYADGRIRTSFKQIMNTGRLSSGSESKKDPTPNFQNLDKGESRRCFIPAEGNTFIVTDYSQQEQILMANICNDANLLAFFRGEDSDMHSYNARLLYPKILGNLSSEEIKKQYPDLRFNAKAAGFSSNYGGTGYTISENLGIPIEDGEAIYEAYMAAFPGLKQYFDDGEKLATKLGHIVFNNITKRKFFIYHHKKMKRLRAEIDWGKRKSDPEYAMLIDPLVKELRTIKSSIRKKAANYKIQGTGADVMKLACIKMYRYIMDNDLFGIVRIANIVHD